MGEKRILVDPFLAAKNTYDPIVWTSNGLRNPMVDLPLTDKELEQLLSTVDMVLVTHTHNDHWDVIAREMISREMPILGQPEDEQQFRNQGFSSVAPIYVKYGLEQLTFTRTGGQHGTGEIAVRMAPVSGFMINDGQHTLYIAGDTVWCKEVEDALRVYKPDFIVLNAGAAQFDMGDPITMTADDVLTVAKHSDAAKIVCVHLDTVNHCHQKRPELRAATAHDPRIIVPDDGDIIYL